MKKVFWIFGIMALMTAGTANAKPPALNDPLLKADFGSESVSGGTNAVTGLGNGRLSVGVSPWSEIIYFRWPRPSFYDQLRYLTVTYGLLSGLNPKDVRYSDDAPSLDWQRYGRPYERYPGLGARGGIYSKGGTLNWFGDPSWSSSRAYEPEWGPVLCTKIENKSSQVTACQWVDWEYDLLVQDFTLNSDSAEKFFYYGTFDPIDGMGVLLGEPDPEDAGFAAIYLPAAKVIIYFHPVVKDPNRLKPHLGKEFTPELIDRLFPEGGNFVAMALIDNPDGFQIGADFRGRKVAKTDPPAASKDAEDGKLSGSPYFIGTVDAGLSKNISAGESKVTVLISAGKSAKDAVAVIEQARFLGSDLLRKKAVTAWQPMMKRVNLPAAATPSEIRVARRNILNLFVGRDRESGAMWLRLPASPPIISTGPATGPSTTSRWTWPGSMTLPGRISISTAAPSAARNATRVSYGSWAANRFPIRPKDTGIRTSTPTARPASSSSSRSKLTRPRSCSGTSGGMSSLSPRRTGRSIRSKTWKCSPSARTRYSNMWMWTRVGPKRCSRMTTTFPAPRFMARPRSWPDCPARWTRDLGGARTRPRWQNGGKPRFR